MKPKCSVFVRDKIVHIIPPRCGTKSFINHFNGNPLNKTGVATLFAEDTGSILERAHEQNLPVVLNLREPMSRAYSGLTMYMLWGESSLDHVAPFLTELPCEYVTHIIPFEVLSDYVGHFPSKMEPTIKDIPREVEVLGQYDYAPEIEIYQTLKQLPVISPDEYFELMG